MSLMNLECIEKLILDTTGIFFDENRRSTLIKGVRERMAETSTFSESVYCQNLYNDKNEFFRLIKHITVNETYFFREPEQIELFSNEIFPIIKAKKKEGERIRIFCAGCSTGEEPYSLAMALMEKYGSECENLFTIIAVDINDEALLSAKKGIYRKNSFRDFSEEMKSKYFIKHTDNRYRIIDEVKSRVLFSVFNLNEERYPIEFKGVDVIFYRNVSIYFKGEIQKKIFKNLSDLLSDQGYLIVSSVETFNHNFFIIKQIEINGIYLYTKNMDLEIVERRNRAKAEKAAESRPETIESSFNKVPGEERRHSLRGLFDQSLLLATQKKYSEALEKINLLFKDNKPFTNAYALKAAILIHLNELDEAKSICRKAIKIDKSHLDSHMLLALIAGMKNEREESRKQFKKAIFIDPSCWVPHFFLAEIYKAENEKEGALREYKSVIRLIGNRDKEKELISFFPLSFPVRRYIYLCNENIKKMEQ